MSIQLRHFEVRMYSMCVFALAIVIFDVSAIVLPKNTTNTAPDLDR